MDDFITDAELADLDMARDMIADSALPIRALLRILKPATNSRGLPKGRIGERLFGEIEE